MRTPRAAPKASDDQMPSSPRIVVEVVQDVVRATPAWSGQKVSSKSAPLDRS